MAAIDPRDELATAPPTDQAPDRPTTPPLRRGFVWVLLLLMMMTILVYGVPLALDRIGYAYEAGRARASSEALARLDKAGAIERASELFRLATNAVSPAVVNIRARSFDPNGPSSIGSGVIIDQSERLVVTNNHVIQGTDVIVVRVGRRTELTADLVGADPRTDLAVVRVRGTLPAQATWGDSDPLEIGDWVLAIGSPYGLDRSVTAGIVSATERSERDLLGFDQSYQNFIQTDASINPGNSGGPLVDLRGHVVGINTAIISDDGAFKGIGLAIPADTARKVVAQLVSKGSVTRGFLGLMTMPLDQNPTGKNKAEAGGAAVVRVMPGSPAEKAGLRAGDVVVKLDGKDVSDPASLRSRAFTLEVGSTIPVEVLRDGKGQTIPLTVAAAPADPVVALFGVTVKDAPRERNSTVVIDGVTAGSPADRAGLKVGDRVIGLGNQPVRTKADFDFALSGLAFRGNLALIIDREGQVQRVNIGTATGPDPHP